MGFELACATSDVPTDEALGVTVGDIDLAIARQSTEQGEEFFAVHDLCSHAHVNLSEGEVAVSDLGTCTIECWLHGSRFDLRTGKPSSFPATEPIATFAVEVREDGVYVDVAQSLNGVTPS